MIDVHGLEHVMRFLSHGWFLFPSWYFAGTTKVRNLDNNIGSLAVKLTKDDLKEIHDAMPIGAVGGQREYDMFSQYVWKSANTPPQ